MVPLRMCVSQVPWERAIGVQGTSFHHEMIRPVPKAEVTFKGGHFLSQTWNQHVSRGIYNQRYRGREGWPRWVHSMNSSAEVGKQEAGSRTTSWGLMDQGSQWNGYTEARTGLTLSSEDLAAKMQHSCDVHRNQKLVDQVSQNSWD